MEDKLNKVEWEEGMLIEALSVHDQEVELSSVCGKYIATGMVSCGEIVDVYDIEEVVC